MESPNYENYFSALVQKLEFLHSERCRFKDDTARVYESLFKEMQRDSEFCAEIEVAVSQSDWAALHGIFYHLYKIESLPFNRDSYSIMRSVLAALSVGKITDAKKILPCGYPESKGHYPMYDQAANMLLCIFFRRSSGSWKTRSRGGGKNACLRAFETGRKSHIWNRQKKH